MKKSYNKAFTLVELLAVIVILGILYTFMLSSIKNLNNKTEVELIEERILVAAKEYVNEYDKGFYSNFFVEGDINYIYKSDLVNTGLIEEDITDDSNFVVKGELIKNDKIKYTVEYLSNENKNYTLEELYNMIEVLQDKVNNNKIESNNKINNVLLKAYPVGSIYISIEDVNPEELFGGEWERYANGRTLVGVSENEKEFNKVNKIGGEKTHTLTKAEMPTHGHATAAGSADGHEGENGVQYFDAWTTIAVGATEKAGYHWETNTGWSGEGKSHNNLQPYITTYMWKRVK